MPGSPKSFKQNSPNYRSPKDRLLEIIIFFNHFLCLRNIPFHDVFINTEDGVKLHGLIIKTLNHYNFV